MKLHGKEYTEVKDRIRSLYGSPNRVFPKSYIVTELFWHSDDMSAILFKATIYPNENDDDKRYFSGWAYEERSKATTDVNFSSWVENCETSAIGRALANMDIGIPEGAARPSKEEMDKVEAWKQPTTAPATTPAGTASKPIKKIAPVSTREGIVKAIANLGASVKYLEGHDRTYVQLLTANGVTDLNDAPIETLLTIRDGLVGYVDSVQAEIKGRGGNKLAELSEDDRKAVEETMKKLQLLMVL